MVFAPVLVQGVLCPGCVMKYAKVGAVNRTAVSSEKRNILMRGAGSCVVGKERGGGKGVDGLKPPAPNLSTSGGEVESRARSL